MQYRTLKSTGTKASVLGLGTMRFPTRNTKTGEEVDEEKAIEIIRTAIDCGINYIDTAYFYHNHKSENVVGKALQDGYREKVLLTTKSPVPWLEKAEDFEKIFEEQCCKLQTDVLDFYFLHNLSAKAWDEKVLAFGLLDKLRRLKQDGKVRHIGFSFHDDFDAFCRILDEFPDCEICQIQLNYADIHHQAGLRGLTYAAEKGLDIVIMEPLRGGLLAAPPLRVAERLSPAKHPVEWGLDFLWNLPEVSVVLSGMGSLDQLTQNIGYAESAAAGMLNPAEVAMLTEAGEVFQKGAMVGCTACGYCTPCPKGIDIPEVFRLYNLSAIGRKHSASKEYQALTPTAAACVSCGLCAKKCPQSIDIPTVLKQANESLSIL